MEKFNKIEGILEIELLSIGDDILPSQYPAPPYNMSTEEYEMANLIESNDEPPAQEIVCTCGDDYSTPDIEEFEESKVTKTKSNQSKHVSFSINEISATSSQNSEPLSCGSLNDVQQLSNSHQSQTNDENNESNPEQKIRRSDRVRKSTEKYQAFSAKLNPAVDRRATRKRKSESNITSGVLKKAPRTRSLSGEPKSKKILKKATTNNQQKANVSKRRVSANRPR